MEDVGRLLHDNPARSGRAALQDELDSLVAALYGLSPDDLAALGDYFAFMHGHGPEDSPVAEPENPED